MCGDGVLCLEVVWYVWRWCGMCGDGVVCVEMVWCVWRCEEMVWCVWRCVEMDLACELVLWNRIGLYGYIHYIPMN